MLKKYFLLLLVFSSSCRCRRPLVTTLLGEVQGYIKTSHDGKNFAAFEGIPYAKPPIGSRRFEEPEPIAPWTGIWNATMLIECAQTTMLMTNQTQGEEDCLYLNVYVPADNSDSGLDVIVDIHGGGFMYGSAHWYTKPDLIMDRNVVFVSINYRVGILGFLSTEDEVVPGNNGLKDQSMALKWVQSNIASFGGNPGSVTIMGASAGGSSVHFHYFSPWSQGLFHRGISISGVALNPFSLQEEALSKTERLANAVGCPCASASTMVKCLKQRPYRQLLDQVKQYFGYKSFPVAPFAPVIERRGDRPFLKKNPHDMLLKGEVLDVPWITSNAAHEGSHFVAAMKEDIERRDVRWEERAPLLLNFNYTLPQHLWTKVSEEIKHFYLGKDETFNVENASRLIRLFTDRIFMVDAEEAVRLQAKATHSPVYYYYFNYPDEDMEDKVSPHGSEVKYLFGGQQGSKLSSEEELKMKDLFLDMVVSYAKKGVPKFGNATWKPTDYNELTYLNISGTQPEDISLQMTKELTPRSFWKSLGFRENENLVSFKDEL